MTTFDTGFCLEPESGKCTLADNTKIVYRSSTTHCKTAESDFIFNVDTGKLVHKCSGKPVCLKDGSESFGAEFVVSSSCDEPKTDLRLTRTYCKT